MDHPAAAREVRNMNCPSAIADILLEIIQLGVLRIRAQGWEGNPGRCAVEADHIHNLPALVQDYSPDRLKYYWEVERPSFVSRSAGASLTSFEPLWDELSRHAGCDSGLGQALATRTNEVVYTDLPRARESPLSEDGKRSEPPDAGLYSENRIKYPLDELTPYCGKTVAWTPDGTRIVAVGPDFQTLWDQMKSDGIDPSQFVIEDIPPLDEDTWL
jgi:hypothetical protein